MRREIKNQLPPQYKSWIDLFLNLVSKNSEEYFYCLKRSKEDIEVWNEFKITVNIIDSDKQETDYVFDPKFIEEKVFWEIIQLLPSRETVRGWWAADFGRGHNRYVDEKTLSAIDNLDKLTILKNIYPRELFSDRLIKEREEQ